MRLLESSVEKNRRLWLESDNGGKQIASTGCAGAFAVQRRRSKREKKNNVVTAATQTK
jgi:hypothetical protein